MDKITLGTRKVSIEFPGVKALSDVDFEISTGMIHAVMGWSRKMEWISVWRNKIVCSTDHRDSCIYRSCSSRKPDLYRDCPYLYSIKS